MVDAVDAGGGAERSGLRSGDRIMVVGSTPSSEVEGLKRTLRRVGGASPIIVLRDGRPLTLRYAAPPLKVDYRYLFLTFIGFLYLAIGLFTLFRGSRGESSLFFFVTLLAFIVYVYSPAGTIDTTYKTLALIEEFARILLPPLSLHFFLRFPRPLLRRQWTLAAIYSAPLLLACWVVSLYSFNNFFELLPTGQSLAVIDRWEMLNFAVYFTLALMALVYTYRTAPAIGEKKQIKWIYLGMGAGFLPFLILYLIPFVVQGAGSAYTTAAILPLAFIPLAFAVSILKYKLWDVEVVIKEILAYTVTFIFGMIAFSTINTLLLHLLEEQLALERNFLAFASGLVIAGVLIPVKGRIETMIDMFLYRDTYRHRKAMTDFAQELATFHDVHELISILRERLAAAVHIARMNLYIRDGESFLLYEREDSAIPRRISADAIPQLPIDRPLILDQPRLPDHSDLAMELLRNGYRYLFPLRHRGELQGMLICGTSRGEAALSRDDLQLVGSLTAPVALAIENARLYGRLRKQLDEIRSLKEYNENIIESSSSAIVVVDETGQVLTANQAFWELIGSGPENLSGIDELFPPYGGIIGSQQTTEQTSFINLAGQQREVTITVSPFSAGDAPDGTIVLVIGDITDRVRLERELQQKERLASLGLLAAGVAHEVNTPLTGISSYAQMLLAETSTDDPRYALLKKMEQQTFRASHLVNNLLDLAAGRRKNAEPVDLAEVARTAIDMYGHLLEAKSITLHSSSLRPVIVESNSSEVEQVLTNLLLNARDAAKEGGNVWFECSEDSDAGTITIRDDGCGVPRELLTRVFEPLFSTRRNQGGTGLGLAISERIVRAWRGELRLDSVEGQGATFSVVLPLWKGKAN